MRWLGRARALGVGVCKEFQRARALRVVRAPAFVIIAVTAGARAVAADVAGMLLRSARVFDGAAMHTGWRVLIKGDRIVAVGADVTAPAGAREIDLPNDTVLPGLIE